MPTIVLAAGRQRKGHPRVSEPPQGRRKVRAFAVTREHPTPMELQSERRFRTRAFLISLVIACVVAASRYDAPDWLGLRNLILMSTSFLLTLGIVWPFLAVGELLVFGRAGWRALMTDSSDCGISVTRSRSTPRPSPT